jgi:tetratricopeptide (TPR) repeat protein
MYYGYRGKQHGALLWRLKEIRAASEELQRKLDDTREPRLVQATAVSSNPPAPTNREVQSALGSLKANLEQFESEYGAGHLSEIESQELRISQGTLANGEQRFREALTMVTAEDEKRTSATRGAQLGDRFRVLLVRGDAFLGLHQWADALARFQQMLQPDRPGILARAADCHYALGRTNEAFGAYHRLAKSYAARGNRLLLDEKPEVAIGQYQKAAGILTRLASQPKSHVSADELAFSHNNLGNALLLQRNSAQAVAEYEKAVEILIGAAPDEEGHPATELAANCESLASVLLAQGKTDEALTNYDKAIAIRSQLLEPRGQRERGGLGLSYNNRGVARCVQGKVDAATRDFEEAIKLLTPLVPDGMGPSATDQDPRQVRDSEILFTVALGYSDAGIDFFSRALAKEQGSRSQPAIALAMTFRNRAYVRLAQGKVAAALGDFEQAVGIYSRLVEQQGQSDFALQYAKTLVALGWLYATNPDNDLRNGQKATQYALKACQLTNWKAMGALETFAAACAETGNFTEALKWEEQAVQMAIGTQKSSAQAKLELYKAGKPCRARVLKPG